MLTGAYKCSGGLADVIAVGVAFDREGGDVVQQARHQASHDVGGLVSVEEICFAIAAAQWSVGDGKAADQAVGGLRLVPAQLHLALLHTQDMETRGRQQVWEQWQPYMSNPYII